MQGKKEQGRLKTARPAAATRVLRFLTAPVLSFIFRMSLGGCEQE